MCQSSQGYREQLTSVLCEFYECVQTLKDTGAERV